METKMNYQSYIAALALPGVVMSVSADTCWVNLFLA